MLQRLTVVLSAAALAIACGQTDAGITTAVKSKFAADDTVRAYEINVTTNNKVVTLDGKVDTSAAKERALTLARETDGVRDVIDHVTVSETAPTTGPEGDREITADDRAREAAGDAGAALGDAAITSAVKAKLLADATVGGLKIDVDTRGGVVTLTGNVATRAEASQAEQLARTTEGVRQVVNNLTVGR